MPNFISFPKGGKPDLVKNQWQLFRAPEGEEAAALPPGKVIVPFVWWLARGTRPEFTKRAEQGEIGVWFAPEDDVLAHADAIKAGEKVWPVIAVDFPIFRDGRGFSTAALLRDRLGWTGELRAVGDVLIDQLLQLARVGFDSFVLRNDQNPELALKQFSLFSLNVQNTWRGERAQLEITK